MIPLGFMAAGKRPPEPVSDLSASVNSYRSITLTWSPPASNGFAIKWYVIEESTNQSTWTEIPSVVSPTASPTYVMSGLSDGETRYFRVYSVSDIGTSDASNTATGTTPAPLATGGTITFSSGNWIHTFTSAGTFTPSQTLSLEGLVVAGGYNGETATRSYSGAGGAGGAVSTGSVTSGTARTITVGAVGGGQSSISGWLSASGAGVAGAARRTSEAAGLGGANGTSSSIQGSAVRYGASGGSGGFSSSGAIMFGGSGGADGAGGGGRGSRFASGTNGGNATVFGSGGGGGGRAVSRDGTGGAGKTGVVVIAYPAS